MISNNSETVSTDVQPNSCKHIGKSYNCDDIKVQSKNKTLRLYSLPYYHQQPQFKQNSGKKTNKISSYKQQGSQKSTFYSSANETKSYKEIDISQQQIGDFQPNKPDVSSVQKVQQKLNFHFKNLEKSDKYIRIISSMLKTYRAYHKDSIINNFYKQLLLTRRIIRLQSKYSTIGDFCTKEQSKWMKAFKVMQTTGDMFDWISLWMLICNKGTRNCVNKIQILQQCQSNVYFLQCCVWLFIYLFRLIALKCSKEDNINEAERKSKITQNSLKSLKYLLDIFTSYNNSSLIKYFGHYNPKLSGSLTVCSSIIGIILLWR